ncbi:MAG: ATP-binding protein [Proteobacteria bacterium]|nr:ATP-binding protein [Pseudomonadota bacterium]
MTVKTRFSLLFGLLCLVFWGSLLALWLYEREENAAILQDVSRQRSELFDRLLTLTGYPLEQFAQDYSRWSEAVQFVDRPVPDATWADVNLGTSLNTFNASSVWVLKPDGTLFYQAAQRNGRPEAAPALPPLDDPLARIQRDKACHFFFEAGGEIYEMRGAGIVPSEDLRRAQPPHGYLFVARRWDAAHVAALARLSQGSIALTSLTFRAPPLIAGRHIHLRRPLPDHLGRTLRILHVEYDAPELLRISETDNWEAGIFILFGITTLILVIFSVWRWVLQPMARLNESLVTGNPAPIQPLLRQRSELGRMAGLVQSWFNNREELRLTLEERARLGRDLHDGVIQTLYASGMNLSSARALLRRDPAAADGLLAQCHAELNATIRDVRNFLVRLEPVASGQKSFGAAVQSLADFMQALRPARFTLEIDDALATRLSVPLRAQLLQIMREAISNALRHGAADAITIRLQQRGDDCELSIRDNGRGFDPAAVPAAGHGLGNFAERARELSASLDIQSKPGHGTSITLIFPLPSIL